MEIISLPFACFVIVTVIIFHILPSKIKPFWLLASSVFFYLLFDIRYFLVQILLLLFNYWIANRIFKYKKPKAFTAFAIGLNLAVIVLLKLFRSKYAIFFWGMGQEGQPDWILPVGLSFYILQLVSFQLEISTGRISTLPKFSDFALYIIYFPKILSGPIEKPGQFLKKIQVPMLVDNGLVSRAFGLIILGLIRKVFIANFLTLLLPDWLNEISLINWSHVLAYGLFIYNDFAGYTSIVRGVSLLFGIELSPNFYQPFFARNFSEFWNRWHITLSTWLKENIFFPLSRYFKRAERNPLGPISAICIPPLTTMLASGFWHGASAAMLFWGGLHAILLILERVLYLVFPRSRPQMLSSWMKSISAGFVFIIFCLSMVPFAASTTIAASTTSATILIWSNLFSLRGFTSSVAPFPLLGFGGLSFLMDFVSEKFGEDVWLNHFNVIIKAAIIALELAIIFLSAVYFSSGITDVFVYEQF